MPNGAADVATLAVSSVTDPAPSVPTQVNGIVFAAGASGYNINVAADLSGPRLTVSGAGVTNNSGGPQNFTLEPGEFGSQGMNFTGNATAGSQTLFTLHGGTVSGEAGGLVQFFGTSTAAQGMFVLEGGTDIEASGGSLVFNESSTAGDGTLTVNNGASAGLLQFRDTSSADLATVVASGSINFFGNSTAGSAIFTVNGSATAESGAGFVLLLDNASAGNAAFTSTGGAVEFSAGATIFFGSNSNAANATLVANGAFPTAGGATIYLADTSSGGTSTIKVYDLGNLDVDFHDASGVTIGSLEGTGAAFLGATQLLVGSNDSSTVFSGVIQDGGTGGGTGGALTKIGAGTLTLSGPNIYTGGTTVEAGTLLAITKRASATGSGLVQVNAGTLGGTSRLSGAITVGIGSGPGAFLAPGVNGPDVLTTQSNVTFNADGTYLCELSTRKSRADQLTAKGITIDNGALFSFIGIGHRAISGGTVFTVLNNTSRDPIAGAFDNLPDDSSFSVGPNTFLVSYEGGTGNDLTLTVQ